MPSRKRTSPPVDVDAIVDRIVAEVEQRGGCTIASCKIPKAVRSEALERLSKRGLEVTAKFVRRPLRDQLREALDAGAFLPLAAKTLPKHLVATTGTEARKEALAMVKAGNALVVLRARGEFLVAPSANVVQASDLSAALKVLDAAVKHGRKATRKKYLLLREDLEALLEPLVPLGLFSSPTRSPQGKQEDSIKTSVVEVAASLVDSSVGLAYVPAVVRKLADFVGHDAAREAVLESASRGEIELRPESGLGRLSQEDRAFCVHALDGTPLTWIRLVGVSS